MLEVELEEELKAELATLLDNDDTGVGADEDEAPPPPPQAEIDKVSAISRLIFKGIFFIKHP